MLQEFPPHVNVELMRSTSQRAICVWYVMVLQKAVSHQVFVSSALWEKLDAPKTVRSPGADIQNLMLGGDLGSHLPSKKCSTYDISGWWDMMTLCQMCFFCRLLFCKERGSKGGNHHESLLLLPPVSNGGNAKPQCWVRNTCWNCLFLMAGVVLVELSTVMTLVFKLILAPDLIKKPWTSTFHLFRVATRNWP